MEKDRAPKPPIAGIIYGKIAYWLAMVGMVIVIVGSIIYLASPQGYVDKSSLLADLWRGCDCHTIWEEASGVSQPPSWYSCVGMLAKGNMLTMLGIAVTCLAAVFGMWGVAFQMVRSKGKLYLIFALIIALVLTLSALGLITLGD